MFDEARKELFSQLGSHRQMVLATGAGNRITARTMSFIVYEDKFYFQTDKRFLKYGQILENPHAAICFNNIQIEGACKFLGHPMEESNAFFAERFKEHYPGSYKAYSHLEGEVAIEVAPILATLWCYDEGKPYRKFIDFENRTARIEYYDNSQ